MANSPESASWGKSAVAGEGEGVEEQERGVHCPLAPGALRNRIGEAGKGNSPEASNDDEDGGTGDSISTRR